MAHIKYMAPLLPVFLLYIHLGTSNAFVSYVPTPDGEPNEELSDFDTPADWSDETEEKVLYRLLNNVLLQKLLSNGQLQNMDYFSDYPEGSYYRPAKRGYQSYERLGKRKVFWQPIGFLPNKVSKTGGSKNSGKAAVGQGQTGQPFRYG